MRIYRDIVQQAWSALWRHPALWIFGLFAALAGNGGEYASIANTVDRISNEASFLGTLQSAVGTDKVHLVLPPFSGGITQSPGIAAAVILLAAITILLMVWVIVVSQVALIRAAGGLTNGEIVPLSQAFSSGVKHFWPVFLLNVLMKFATYLLLVSALLPFLIYYLVGAGSWNFDGVIIVSFIAFVPLTVILSFVLKYAAMYVVIEGERWWHALERAFNLFFRNWLVSLEMAGLLLIINLAVGIALAFVFIPDTISFYSTLLTVGTDINPLFMLRILLGLLAFLLVGSWFATFQYLAWMFLFRRLQAGSVVAKLVRLTGNLPAVPWLGVTSTPKPSAQKK